MELRYYLCFILILSVFSSFSSASSPHSYYNFNSEQLEFQNSYNSNNLRGKASSIRFDGNDDYVKAPYTGSMDIKNELTIAGWVYLEKHPDQTAGNDYRLIFGRSNGYDPYGLLLEESSTGLVGSTFLNESRQYVAGGIDPAEMVDKWSHVAFTYDGNTGNGTIYLNGTILGTGTYETGQFDTSTKNIQFTEPGGPSGHTWNGKMSDMRLYNRSLNSSEIEQLYSGRNVEQDLVSYWPMFHKNGEVKDVQRSNNGYWQSSSTSGVLKFERFTNSSFRDLSSKNNHGTYTEMVEGSFSGANDGTLDGGVRTESFEGKAVRFDETGDIDVPNSNSLNFQETGFSVSAWFKTNSTSMTGSCCLSHTIVEKYGGGQGYMLGVAYGDTIYASFFDDTGGKFDPRSTPPSDFNDNNWHHVVGVNNGTHAMLYYDGYLLDTQPAKMTDYSNSDSLRIGGGFNGTIDNVKIYDDPLDKYQVKDLYKQRRDLYAQQKAEYEFEGSGNTIEDTSMIQPGVSESSLSIDGVNDQVSFPENEEINSSMNSENWTISFFFKPRNQLNDGDWRDFINMPTKNSGMFRIEHNKNLGDGITAYWSIDEGTSGHNPADYICSFKNLNKTKWYHLAVTMESSSKGAKCFVDGDLSDEESASAMADHEKIKGSINILSDPGESYNIDSFKIFNSTMSSSEIQKLRYGHELSKIELRDFSFDSMQNNTIYDTSMLGTGKNGKGLQLKEGNGYAYLPDSSSLSPSDEVTVAAWIKQTGTASSPYQRITDKGSGLTYWVHDGTGDTCVRLSATESGGSAQTCFNTNLQKDKWHHLAFSYDSDTNETKLYLNGSLFGTSTYYTGQMSGSGSALSIGNSGGSRPWVGSIDELKIETKELTKEEIFDMYQSREVGLAQETSSPDPADFEFESGIFGTDSIQINSRDSRVKGEILRPDNGFTASFWLWNSNKWDRNRTIWKDANGKIRLKSYKGNAVLEWTDGNDIYGLKSHKLAPEKWYRATVSYNRSENKFYLYIDGQEQNIPVEYSGEVSKTGELVYTSRKQIFGGNSEQNFRGRIDDVFFFNESINPETRDVMEFQ